MIMVEGPEYSTNFAGFDKLPVRLNIADRLVSRHTHTTFNNPFGSYDELKQIYDARAGFLLHSRLAFPCG